MKPGDLARVTHPSVLETYERSLGTWPNGQPVLILEEISHEDDGVWRDLVLIQAGHKTLWIPRNNLEVINE